MVSRHIHRHFAILVHKTASCELRVFVERKMSETSCVSNYTNRSRNMRIRSPLCFENTPLALIPESIFFASVDFFMRPSMHILSPFETWRCRQIPSRLELALKRVSQSTATALFECQVAAFWRLEELWVRLAATSFSPSIDMDCTLSSLQNTPWDFSWRILQITLYIF